MVEFCLLGLWQFYITKDNRVARQLMADGERLGIIAYGKFGFFLSIALCTYWKFIQDKR